jgi:hypothetical protein
MKEYKRHSTVFAAPSLLTMTDALSQNLCTAARFANKTRLKLYTQLACSNHFQFRPCVWADISVDFIEHYQKFMARVSY